MGKSSPLRSPPLPFASSSSSFFLCAPRASRMVLSRLAQMQSRGAAGSGLGRSGAGASAGTGARAGERWSGAGGGDGDGDRARLVWRCLWSGGRRRVPAVAPAAPRTPRLPSSSPRRSETAGLQTGPPSRPRCARERASSRLPRAGAAGAANADVAIP